MARKFTPPAMAPVPSVTSSVQFHRYDEEDTRTFREIFSHHSPDSWAKHNRTEETFVPNFSSKPLTLSLRQVLPDNI